MSQSELSRRRLVPATRVRKPKAPVEPAPMRGISSPVETPSGDSDSDSDSSDGSGSEV